MSTLYHLPLEVLLESIFPYLDASDLVKLAAANRGLHTFICHNERLWKRRIQEDFSVDPERTGWTSQWCKLYPRFKNPSVLAWRQPGRPIYRYCTAIGDGYDPVELQIPSPVYEISASASAFHALDANGEVYVWGMLNGTRTRTSSGDPSDFSNAGTEATRPTRLALPRPVSQLSCGRVHSAALDVDGRIWNMQSWGRSFTINSPLLDCSSLETTPWQLQAGSGYTSALMRSGEVLIWYPGDGDMFQAVKSHGAEAARNGHTVVEVDGVIPCQPWEMEVVPRKLPPLPPLPDLADTERNAEDVSLVKVYGTWRSLVGVTNHGHVVKINVGCDLDPLEWIYLPHYSDPTLLHELLGQTLVNKFSSITITTHSNRFIVSFGEVVHLLGYETDSPHSLPRIIPGIGNGSTTIACVQGDHLTGSFEAFSDRGEVFTWEQPQPDEDEEDDESLIMLGGTPHTVLGGTPQPIITESDVDSDGGVKVRQRTFGGRRMFCRFACGDMSYTVGVGVCLDSEDV